MRRTICGAWIIATALQFCSLNVRAEAAKQVELQSIPGQAFREWTAATGGRQANARLLGAGENRARLEKPDGRVMTISLATLSAPDQQLVQELLTQAATPRPAAALASIANIIAPAPAEFPPAQESQATPMPPNVIYVRLSQPFLNRYVSRRVFKQGAVSDNILGTPISGTSNTTGTTRLALVPDTQRARVDLHLTGTADAQTVGSHDPVWIYTSSRTEFSSSKQVLIEEGQIRQSPAQTQARCRSTTTNITTDLGPLLSRIVLRAAWQQVNDARAEADSIAASHTARRVDRELDQAVSDAAGRIHAAVAYLDQALEHRQVKRPRVLASTTSDYLQLILLRDDADASDLAQFVPPPAEAGPHPDIEVAVHSTVVYAAIKDGELRASLEPVLNSPWYWALLKLSSTALLPPGSAPANYELKWSDGGRWLTVDWNCRPRAEKQKDIIAQTGLQR